ncbi:MAG: aminoglycoside phosphotransferase family protein [Phenylobacterium sp.]
MPRLHIDADLVRRLIADQFPHWAHLPVRPVEHGGNDNRTFHLGETMSVRLPSHAAYATQVEKEQRWLPRLAPSLPLPIPAPLAQGRPSADFPLPWSVCRWLDGETAEHATIDDQIAFARDLAGFLRSLQRADAVGGPPAGPHSFHRGGSLWAYDAEVRGLPVDPDLLAVWEAALGAQWEAEAVWVHGDVAPGNLLVAEGRLSAVIDFGCSAVGDPACDLVIAWTFLDGAARDAFRTAMRQDAATWARARGWALWKALICLEREPSTKFETRTARAVLAAVIAEHRARG